ncbi:protein kinase domain-containing protein [Streptomyces sp. NBC_01508]|uniref:protein kinase domain-containing protein n=1 Tax=Streptomyces sp. NBC_01508 TaxID=2903888 RepID=UPI003867FB95
MSTREDTRLLAALSDVSPRRIGPFTVLARIGAGGMGDVYLATPRPGAPVDRLVAVKTVRRDLADDPSFRSRFRRETALAGTVDSPYTATLVDVDADAELPWMAAEYVAGPTLAEAVRRAGPLPRDAVARLGADLATALGGLHAARIVHRDVKPGNILLDLDRACLIDFGLARAQGGGTGTEGDLVVGTPDFMSPEHLRGSHAVTAASDVFSLAAVLCYAATGRKPFGEGRPVQVVQHRISTADASIDSVPEGLRDTLKECLSPDPARRPSPDLLRERLSSHRAALWPAGIRTLVEECRRDAVLLSATGGPLLAPPATDSPVTDPSTTDPTATDAPAGEPRRRGEELPDRSGRRPRRRAALALALVAVLGAGVGLGTYLSRPQNRTANADPALTPPATGSPLKGVDDRGAADSSGAVPQLTDQRPENWRPWQGKLSGPAMGCAAGTAVLVCRLTDGTYEARDSATGRGLWTVGRYDARAQTTISGTGYVSFAARSTQPTVHGGDVVLSTDGWLQVRDARTGKIRWEQESAGALGFSSRPLAADELVFAATVVGGNLGLTAFALADGRKLWSKVLTNQEYARAHLRDFEPVAYADGRVYALGDGGVVAYDARTGARRGQVQGGARACDSLRIAGPTAFCSHWEASTPDAPVLSLLRLDAVTLAPEGRLSPPRGIETAGVAGLTAVDHRVAVVFDPDGRSRLGADDATPAAGLIVLDQRTGRERGRYRVASAVSGGRGKARTQAFSEPMIAGDSLVYADFSALHVIPLGRDGRPGKEHVLAVPGAPGPRPGEPQDDPFGETLPSESIRSPVLLPLGGVAFVVYDKGAVASVALPG